MTDVLKTLLEAGKTPEAIYQDALNILQEMNAAKEKENKRRKEFQEARCDLISALDEYLTVVLGAGIGEEKAAALEKDLIKVEDAIIAEQDNKSKERKIPVMRSAGTAKRSDDEILKDYTKWLLR